MAPGGELTEPTETTETPQPDDGPLLTCAEFLELESLAALQARYRERGFAEADDLEAVTTRAQQDWFKVAFQAALQVKQPPERLEPIVVKRGDLTVELYGLFHGLIGGNDREYKGFVNAALEGKAGLLFENALGYFYPGKRKVGIPDFLLNGALGSARLGFEVGLSFPVLVYEGFTEVFKLRRKPDEDTLEAFEYSPRYHAVDPEVRRGLEQHPPLPSRLEIEYWMGEWDKAGALATWRFPGAIVPRSMFMAGFAVGYAESRGLDTVRLVIGDHHTMEVVRFLEREDLDHPVFRAGVGWGRRSGPARVLLGWAQKLFYLTISGAIGATLIVSVLILVFLVYGMSGPLGAAGAGLVLAVLYLGLAKALGLI